MNETEYRRKVSEALDQIEDAFSEVDPDIAECEQTLGSLKITSADKSRLIMSAQPSVRQIWLALAAKGIAHHFNFVPTSGSESEGKWFDDKGKNVELFSFLKAYFKESAKLDIQF